VSVPGFDRAAHHDWAVSLCLTRPKPEPLPKLTTWSIYKVAAKAVRLGQVEAPDETTAMERGVAEFKVPANRLMAVRR
jgi:hypothetical protein